MEQIRTKKRGNSPAAGPIQRALSLDGQSQSQTDQTDRQTEGRSSGSLKYNYLLLGGREHQLPPLKLLSLPTSIARPAASLGVAWTDFILTNKQTNRQTNYRPCHQ